MAKQPPVLTNDTAKLVPKTRFDGPALEFDFPALQIGVAAYTEGPTGCTVFRFANDPTSVVDIRGGFPGQPFHSFGGGDILFAVSTGEVENPLLNLTDLGVLASELAWDAVLNC